MNPSQPVHLFAGEEACVQCGMPWRAVYDGHAPAQCDGWPSTEASEDPLGEIAKLAENIGTGTFPAVVWTEMTLDKAHLYSAPTEGELLGVVQSVNPDGTVSILLPGRWSR